jgi:hypothetical protein
MPQAKSLARGIGGLAGSGLFSTVANSCFSGRAHGARVPGAWNMRGYEGNAGRLVGVNPVALINS